MLKKDPTNCRIIYNLVDKHPDYTYLGFTISKASGYYVHVYYKTTSVYSAELEHALTAAIDESATAIFRIKRFLKFKYLDMDTI